MKQAAWLVFSVLALSLCGMGSSVYAQDSYPSSPIKMVVGFAPGGASDAIGRLLAQKLSAQMNANVVVDNKPGASGNLGAEFVAKSAPNGYTLFFTTPGLVLSPALGEKLGYDVFKDLAPVARIASAPYFLVATTSLPANTVAEFIAHVRAHPGKLIYGSGGATGTTYLGPLLFLQLNGLSALHVPYKGAGPALTDLVAGRIHFRFTALGDVLPLVKDKRLKLLGVASLKRLPLLPDVPALAETTPGFEVGTWFGVLAAANTPPAIVKKLNGEILRTLQTPDMKSRLEEVGAEPLETTPEEFGAYLRSEFERWSKVIKSAGVKPE